MKHVIAVLLLLVISGCYSESTQTEWHVVVAQDIDVPSEWMQPILAQSKPGDRFYLHTHSGQAWLSQALADRGSLFIQQLQSIVGSLRTLDRLEPYSSLEAQLTTLNELLNQPNQEYQVVVFASWADWDSLLNQGLELHYRSLLKKNIHFKLVDVNWLNRTIVYDQGQFESISTLRTWVNRNPSDWQLLDTQKLFAQQFN